ncbi:hypothetical protein BD324DRAFT_650484 [Kockovaella imperatae]|uniref:Uncharacterized protein n=1 Tax=Kockovaella imperatae TaxID=4999 RepID=A0A1Y1UIQ5_9TREE|nr:hypothetical protein BD324DRAFT_650484 [Kockovaella imperatae]ORX37943.1 hypothetical protein BD324DRAFT_650484 [Kockovaella imperatae]
MSRSTAPVITSPLEAWPARPFPRASPLSSKVSSTSSLQTTTEDYSVGSSTTAWTLRDPSSVSVVSSTMTFGESSTAAVQAAAKDLSSSNSDHAPINQANVNDQIPDLAATSRLAKLVQTPPPRLRVVKGSRDTDEDDHSQSRQGEGSSNGYSPGHGSARGGGGCSSSTRAYAPPRKPLTPGQLGRIAQSFGIVIPSLPHPSPTSLSLSPLQAITRSPNAMTHQTMRGTPWLITVIPPFSILLPLPLGSSGDSVDAPSSAVVLGTPPESSKLKERRRKWKRGRLLPLQPTMGSMLLSIAREYGLPSTQGVNLYLVYQPPPTHLTTAAPLPTHSHSASISSTGSFGSSFEEATGPQISAQTWSTLFASYLVSSASSSRASTPANTPLKSSGPLGRDIAFPPSPLSLVEHPIPSAAVASESTGIRPDKLSPTSLASSPDTNGVDPLPPTPFSLNQHQSPHLAPQVNPIVGTIEFDVDIDSATWYQDWRKSARTRPSHSRKISSVSDSGLGHVSAPLLSPGPASSGGIRQLKLVRKVNDSRGMARFLRDVESNRPPYLGMDKPRSMSLSAASGAAARDARVDPLPLEHAIIISGSDRTDVSGLLGPATNESSRVDDLSSSDPPMEVVDDLLASPIALDKTQLELQRVREVVQEVIMDKRGSGLVMSDELDKLEQLMRTLSPREIRVTSPRMLTPRMAAKIAAAKIQAEGLTKLTLSPNPNGQAHSSLLPSPLASTFTAPSKATPESLPRVPKSSTDSTNATSASGSRRVAWPAVPHSESPESSRITEYFQAKAAPQSGDDTPSPRSAETLQRAQQSSHAALTTTTAEVESRYAEWRPRRPQRPTSPGLEQTHRRTPSYTLPQTHVDQLRQVSNPLPGTSTQPSTSPAKPPPHILRNRTSSTELGLATGGLAGIGESPRSPPPVPRDKGRRGSNAFKGLKNQISARNLNIQWGPKQPSTPSPEMNSQHSSPALPAESGSRQTETLGLFSRSGPSLDHQTTSSFASLNGAAAPAGAPAPPSKDSLPRKVYTGGDLSPPIQMGDWDLADVPSPPTHTFSSNNVVVFPSALKANHVPHTQSPLQSREPNSHSVGISSQKGPQGVASKWLGSVNGFTFGKKASVSALREQAGFGPGSNGPAGRSVSDGHARNLSTGRGRIPHPNGSGSQGRRNPSIDSASIGSPIVSTFRQVEGTSPHLMSAGGVTHPRGPSSSPSNGIVLDSPPFTAFSFQSQGSGMSTELPYRSPAKTTASSSSPMNSTHKTLPESPGIKRKPVPSEVGVGVMQGMTTSDSFASSRSFVLEDPPKRRLR